jgi:quercetin dioxygenase-like cupin family protein
MSDDHPHIRRHSGPRDVPNRPGMREQALVGPADGVHEMFVADIVFDPGAEIPLHVHPIAEAFVVLDGELTFRLGDETLTVGPDRTVSIPPGTPHGVVNTSDGQARSLAAAPWDHATFFREQTTYLEGKGRD